MLERLEQTSQPAITQAIELLTSANDPKFRTHQVDIFDYEAISFRRNLTGFIDSRRSANLPPDHIIPALEIGIREGESIYDVVLQKLVFPPRLPILVSTPRIIWLSSVELTAIALALWHESQLDTTRIFQLHSWQRYRIMQDFIAFSNFQTAARTSGLVPLPDWHYRIRDTAETLIYYELEIERHRNHFEDV